MIKKVMGWKTKGMNRDLSVSAFNPEFSFENINLRLITNEGNTAMSWVNERGTKTLDPEITINEDTKENTIYGITIGTAVLNQYLVIFTTAKDYDRIYRLEYDKTAKTPKKPLTGVLLFKGNLGFSADYPLETLASYETDAVQKVYWVDGKHQPRVINIVSDKSAYLNNSYTDTSFDFVQELKLQENVAIQKQIGAGGMFAPGVIQYAFTYFNKNGQESNIFYTSPLLYISHADRGASPEDRVANAFKIKVANVEKTFDYIRIYSLQRTSINGTPIAKRVQDISIASLSDLDENAKSYNSCYAVDTILSIKRGEQDLSSFHFEDIGAGQNQEDAIGSSQTPFVRQLNEQNSQYLFCGTGNNNNPNPDNNHFYGWLGFRLNSYKDNTSEITVNTFDSKITFKPDVEESTLGEEAIKLYDTVNLYSSDAPETASVPMIWVSCLITKNTEDGSFDVFPTKLKGNYGTKYYIVTTSQIIRKAESAGEGEPVIGYSYEFNSSEDAVTGNLMQSEGFSVSFIDTGTGGDSIDPAELLYKGGQSIVAGTIDQKDNTLFLGNLHLSRPSLQNLELEINGDNVSEDSRSFLVEANASSEYTYGNQLSAREEGTLKSVSCGGFKRGEMYRLGIQFQYKDGSWSEPKYLSDVEETEKPEIDLNQTKVTVPTFKYTLTKGNSSTLINAGFRKARALVVFPDITDRKILCQGIVNSTLYTGNTDINNKHQNSWFFRPNGGTENTGTEFTPTSSGTLPYTQGGPTKNGADKPVLDSASLRKTEVQGNFNTENEFQIDNQLWSFNTPELDYEEAFPVLDFTGTAIQQVGTAVFNKTFSSIYLQTESPAISSSGAGFTKRTDIFNAAKGFISGLFYDDYVVNDYEEGESSSNFGPALEEGASVKWLVYPWQRNGSLNNDFERSGSRGNRSAVLKKKVLSNLRYSTTAFLDKPSINSIPLSQNTSPTLFNSDQIDIVKVGDIVYQGNIDTVLVSDEEEGMYFAYASTDFSPTEHRTTDFGDNIDWMTWSLSATDNKGTGLWSHKKKLTYHTQRQDGTKVYPAGWYDGDDLILEITESGIADGTEQVRWFWYDKRGIRPGWYYRSLVKSKPLVRMKYKSSPHLVFKVDDTNPNTPPYVDNGLKICEILSSGKDDATRFGGATPDALQANVWIPCGEPVALDSTKDVDVLYSYGDTYFQRWDCLKTSPLNSEDTNQIVEIGSFMLETRLNIDGRYDRNRGLLDNTNINDRNFNLYNPVYSQINNFFSYKIMPDDYYQNAYYKNQITWTLTKQSGVDVDPWTNITLASTMELDGDKGPVNKIIRLNDQLLVFQDTGISQLLYNENTQISTTAGVPIEIANSGKVQGKRYISNNIGCINKWSIVTTPMGIYFIDSIGKNIHLFNGQLTNISSVGGFNSWCKANIPDPKVKVESEAKEWLVWTPDKKTDEPDKKTDEFVGYYDRNNQDVLFINNNTALAWSEKFQIFTSFYDYGVASYFCNLNASGIWLVNGSTDTSIYEHQAGEEYCKFFEANKPYGMTLVANPDAQLDKTFSNLEFRANVDNDDTLDDKGRFTPFLPFDELEVWNDYQHGMSSLENKLFKKAVLHPDSDGSSALRRKFRIWRCDIPRDNAPCSEEDKARDKARGIFRIKSRPLDRMRNPWLYIKLMKKAKKDENLDKVEIHDIVLDYYI